MIASDFTTVLPEVLLSLYAMLALVVFVYTGKDRHAALSVWLTSGAFMLLALILAMGTPAGTASFGGMFIDDSFARFCKIVILLSAALVLVMGQDYAAKHDMLKFEYPLLVALSVVGMMVMVSAGSLLTLYMGLELQSLALYVIAAFRRDSAKSTEAGLKYFVLGALSSGLLLYGTSLVYGFAGTVGFSGISAATGNGDLSIGLLLGLVFVIAGMGFKVSAAPFHMWAPDVYEGAPTPVTAFFCYSAKDGGYGPVCPCCARCVRRCDRRLATGGGRSIGLFNVSWCSGSDWAKRHQTSDGLFFNRAYGLCVDGSGRRHGVRRSSHVDLHGDLYLYEHRYVCPDPLYGA